MYLPLFSCDLEYLTSVRIASTCQTPVLSSRKRRPSETVTSNPRSSLVDKPVTNMHFKKFVVEREVKVNALDQALFQSASDLGYNNDRTGTPLRGA